METSDQKKSKRKRQLARARGSGRHSGGRGRKPHSIRYGDSRYPREVVFEERARIKELGRKMAVKTLGKQLPKGRKPRSIKNVIREIKKKYSVSWRDIKRKRALKKRKSKRV